MGKLNAKMIQNLPLGRKARKHYDGNGLFLLVNGVGKYWRYKYRYDGKEKVLAIGVYPDVSLKDARARHREARDQLGRGVDPGLVKKAKKAAKHEAVANTFGSIAWEWFVKQAWSDGHRKKQKGRLNNDIIPFIGDLDIKKITPRDVLDVCRRIESRGVIDGAHRVKTIISQVFRYGIANGMVDSDPCRDLRKALTPYISKPMAALTGPAEVGGLLRAIDGYTGGHVVRAALRLAPLVFLRPGELRHGEWDEIDFQESMWRIPGEKMKGRRDHMVPLSKQSVSILKEIEPITGSGRYIFPSIRTASRPISNNTLNAALRRMGFTTEEQTAHGFRSTASTLLHEAGWDTNVIEMQMAHKDLDTVRGVYNRAKYLPQRIKLMQAWADLIDRLKSGPA